MNQERTVTTDTLFRWSGAAAAMAGGLYMGIQWIHPADALSSVSTDKWVIVAFLTAVMSICSLVGVSGIYLRQTEETGWLGLIGFILFSLFWLISMTFSFIEAFVLPLLVDEATAFVEGMAGIFSGTESETALGIFPALAPAAGILYMLGGLLLGLATFRAGVFPRLSGALLAFSAVITVAAAVIPHPFDRILALPMGITLIWLGFSLWWKDKKQADTANILVTLKEKRS